MKRIRIVESEVVEYFCDVCGCEVDNPQKINTCSICGRLVCREHRINIHIRKGIDRMCCDICIGMGGLFREEIKNHEISYEQLKLASIYSVLLEWKRRSLEHGGI